MFCFSCSSFLHLLLISFLLKNSVTYCCWIRAADFQAGVQTDKLILSCGPTLFPFSRTLCPVGLIQFTQTIPLQALKPVLPSCLLLCSFQLVSALLFSSRPIQSQVYRKSKTKSKKVLEWQHSIILACFQEKLVKWAQEFKLGGFQISLLCGQDAISSSVRSLWARADGFSSFSSPPIKVNIMKACP